MNMGGKLPINDLSNLGIKNISSIHQSNKKELISNY